MGENRIIRAWKDSDYRQTLDGDALASLPESPVGTIELDDEDLGDVAGGAIVITQTTICATTWACVTVATIAISKNISCGACDTTLWSGTCAVSSIGCCS
jgi:mersacidin/lichenicidin family type 2 lantibiotic